MSIRLNTAATLLAALGAGLLPAAATAQTKLLRFPDIAGDRVAFCYAGDIWTAPAKGGSATRLTAHPGLELFPKFSPDGKSIAFTGQYEGDEQVYVVPAEGGEPRQLTYYPARGPYAPRHGYDNQVMGWTPDGSAILFRSPRDADGIRSEGRLYTVALKGGLPKALPMPTSGAGAFSPDGKRLAYSPLFRDFRTWKRYEGGWAQDLYLYDLATNDAKPFATSVRTERDPMWIGNAVYFASDRDGTLNLYSYDLATEAVAKLTTSATWDVRWPSSDNVSRIVYELDGELRVFDVRAKADQAISIFVPNDGVARRPSRHSAEKNVEDFDLSPKGERAVVVARGDVFTVPIEKGPTRNLTNSSNAHDKWARWSPDGKRIAFLSDRSGEDEVWLVDQAGGKPEQVTTGGQAMRYAPEWSAEGTHLAFSDKDGKLYVVTLADRKTVQVADDPRGMIRDYTWSPKGAYLAFSMNDPSGTRSLHVWSASDTQVHRLTDDVFNEYAPTWDPEGEYLYYQSERQFAPQISQVEWNFAGARMTGLFALTLKKDGKSPFPPPSDEVTFGEKKDEAKPEADKSEKKDDKAAEARDKAKAEPEKKETPFRIDFDGLGSRVTPVPVDADNYQGVVAVKGHLLYVKADAPFYGRDPRVEDDARHLLDEGPQGVDPRRGRRRLGGLARRQQGPRPRRRRPAAPRREARREGEEDRLHEGPDGGPRSRPGVGGDLRRGLAALPGLLLRDEHARLRLEGDRRALPRPPAPRGPPRRPQLRPRRDGGGAQRRPRLHRGRRLRDPGAAEGRPPGSALRARREGRALPHRPDPARARTRRNSTARRSPRSAWTRRWATTSSRSTASRSGPTTTRTGCCGTRPTPSP